MPFSFTMPEQKYSLSVCLFYILATALALSCNRQPVAGLEGLVLYDQSRPVRQARVIVANQMVETDEFGRFSFKELQAGRHVVSISAAGFALLSRQVELKPGKRHSGEYHLVDLVSVKRVRLDKKTTLNKNNLKLVIEPGSFVDRDGNPVATADLTYRVIDVRGHEARSMPGNFKGISTEGTTTDIESFGAVDISFKHNDRLLQIKKGKTLYMRMPLQGKTAPGEKHIPMWSFNTRKGTWIEEGQGRIISVKSKRYVEARLPHLSWWNADKPVTTRSTIWIKSINASDGKGFEGDVIAAGASYNGRSGVFKGFKRDGFCVEVKRNSKVFLSAFEIRQQKNKDFLEVYTDQASKKISTVNVQSTCESNPEDGVIIPRLVLKKGKAKKIPGIEAEKLLDLKEKHGQLTEIFLSDGRKFIGTFKQVDKNMTLFTTKGVIKVDPKSVKYIKPIDINDL